MIRSLPKIGQQRGLRYVFVSQILLAVLLIGVEFMDILPRLTRERVELPEGPVSPGDQRREYRTDDPGPSFLTTEGPAHLDLPAAFPSSLNFERKEVDGTDMIVVSGEIAEGDADRFSDYLAGLDAPPSLVTLHSPGGVVAEALIIGRLLREKEFDTAVLEGAFCASSCPYILAAGMERRVSLAGAIGLHQHYYEQPGYMPVMFAVENIQSGQGRTMEYLIDMGVDPSIMVYALKTPPEQVYVLVEEELRTTRIATEIIE